MEVNAPPDWNVQILPNPEEGEPLQERRFPDPEFTRCNLRRRLLSDQQGGNPEWCLTMTENASGRTWIFQRRIMEAIHGEVWRAVEVDVRDGRYSAKYYNDGSTRRVAVKIIFWEGLQSRRSRFAEVLRATSRQYDEALNCAVVGGAPFEARRALLAPVLLACCSAWVLRHFQYSILSSAKAGCKKWRGNKPVMTPLVGFFLCFPSVPYLVHFMYEDPWKEISALTILSDPGHPNVLRREAALHDDKAAYLVTRYVDGGEIFKWIAEERGAYHQGRIDTVRNVFRQLVQGMQYTHSKGICHADMSLENALVDMRRENAYIIDYGMSLLMPVVTRDGHNRRRMSIHDSRTSKPAYRSPETSYGLAYDGVKVDVFSAGAMLFIMLTGCRTFAEPRWFDPRYKLMVLEGKIEQAINQNLQMLELDANQAADLEEAVDLLRRMMARKPADRPLPENVLQHQWLAR